MKKQKNIKKWKFDKKQKLTKAMILTIVSFCTFCCFALHFACGLALLGMCGLLYYILTRPVELNLPLSLRGDNNDKDS